MNRGVFVFTCLLAGLLASAPATSAGPLRTGFMDPRFDGPDQAIALQRTQAAGASMVRLFLNWRDVAPSSRPIGFIPRDPRDPAYEWRVFDQVVSAVVGAGLEPIVTVQAAPVWAGGPGAGPPGTVHPDPVEFGYFARAAATRYSGSFRAAGGRPLPRVRYWQAWNEPNRDPFLMPQCENGRIASAALYRGLVNRFATAVHAADASNVVIAGGLAPLGRACRPGPMAFMRAMLCMSPPPHRRTCDLRSAPAEFDAWSHHPYTSGGPTHEGPTANDAALGDLPEMRRLLRAAIRAGHVRSTGRVGFWVTEFAWDSNPPDPRALGARLHARWVAEALYRMWRNGVSVVTWFRIQDDPLRATPYQSGFYRTDGRRKASLKAFRFPVVAFRGRTSVYVWGRTPAGSPGRVVVQMKSGGRWRTLGGLSTDGHGIFARRYRTAIRRGYVRARFSTGEVSLAFSLTPVRDRYVNPFGCGGGIPC